MAWESELECVMETREATHTVTNHGSHPGRVTALIVHMSNWSTLAGRAGNNTVLTLMRSG